MRDAFFDRLGLLVYRHALLIVLAATLVSVLSGWYAAANLRLNANTDDLIAKDAPFAADYRAFLNEFGDLEYIYAVVVHNGDRDWTEAAVDALTERLRQIPALPGVFSAIEPHEQLRIATRAMTDQQLAGFSQSSDGFATLIENRSAQQALGDAGAWLGRAVSSGGRMSEPEQERAAAAAVFLLGAVAAAEPGAASAIQMSGLIDPPQRRYLTSPTGQLYFITILPVKDYSTLSVIEAPLRQIRAAIGEIRARFPGVEIGLTGKPVLAADELSISNDDMFKASLLAFLLCSILFILMVGGLVRPLLAITAFLAASAWTYGAAALLVGQLNLLSIVFMLVLVGVGLDYGVHVISRYIEYRRTQDTETALRSMMRTAVRGNVTGALTSSVVFYTGLLTDFGGLQELGLIAGTGLLLCLVAMTFVLPALLVLTDRRREPTHAPHVHSLLDVDESPAHKPTLLERLIIRHPGWILAGAGIITVALLVAPGSLRFDQNLLNLQARGLESVQWEHRIREDSSAATWFAAIIAESPQQVADVIAKARTKESIGSIESVLDVIQIDTLQRDEWRLQLHAAAPIPASSVAASAPAGVSSTSTARDGAAEASIAEALQRSIAQVNLLAPLARSRDAQAAARLEALRDDLSALRRRIENDQLQAGDAVDATLQRIDLTLATIAASLREILAGDRLPLREALPDALRDSLMSPQGLFLVKLHPRHDVWDYLPMKRFIDDLRSIDPHVTGAPVAHFESMIAMRSAFGRMALLSLLAVTILLLLDFRHLGDAALCLLPMGLGLLWCIELMGLFGVSFNLANFFAIPILIGLGVDSAVHILHRYHEGGPNRLMMGSTRRAVTLTSLTTIIGFGCLLMAHHRGLFSLGVAMSIGSTTCLVASILVLPAILALRERYRARKAGAAPPTPDAEPDPEPAVAAAAR